MTSTTSARFGDHDVTIDGRYLREMRDANALLDDAVALRSRLAEDGYLLLRDFHDQDQVLTARHEIFSAFAERDAFDPATPLSDGMINPRLTKPVHLGSADLIRDDAFLRLVKGDRVMSFFARLLGEPALTFGYRWVRLTGRGECTRAHFDNVYMSRGSTRLHTMWTPLGDVPIQQGPLAVLVGSHDLASYARVRETYGRMDVDRDRVAGLFEEHPEALTDRFGGHWATTEFRAGDMLVFGMLTMHASLTNVSDRYRLTSDTRYQPAAEPVDERWAGDQPNGRWQGPLVPMEQKRAEWGI